MVLVCSLYLMTIVATIQPSSQASHPHIIPAVPRNVWRIIKSWTLPVPSYGHGKTKYSEYYNTDCIDIVYLHRYKPTSQHLLDTKCFQGRYVFSTIINIFKITSLFEWSIKGYLKEIQSRKLDYLKYSSMIRKKFNC